MDSRWGFRALFLLVVVGFLLAGPWAALAQAPITLHIVRADWSRHPTVILDLLVRDGRGLPVPGLGPGDFDVSEDRTLQARPVEAVTPWVNPDAPMVVVLALDLSGSMKGQPLADAKAAALALLDKMGPEDKVACIGFRDAVDLERVHAAQEVRFTQDKAALAALIRGWEAGGNTPLYDAAYKAIRWAAEQAGPSRAVILLTDGVDEVLGGPKGSGSRVANEDTPIRTAQQYGVPVFTIGLGRQMDRPWLQRVAEETGGEYRETPDSAALTDLFLAVVDRLKQTYRLTYRSAVQPDGREHDTLVVVKHAGATAMGEVRWGPLGAMPTPTDTPKPPTATPTSAPPTPTPAPTAAPAAPTSGGRLSLGWWLGGGGGLLFLALLGLALSRRRPKPVYCLRCGHRIPPGEPCPYCGAAGEFEEPGSR